MDTRCGMDEMGFWTKPICEVDLDVKCLDLPCCPGNFCSVLGIFFSNSELGFVVESGLFKLMPEF